MKQRPSSNQALARKAFGLVLELRTHHDARQLLGKAVAFLEMLARGRDTRALPVMVSVQMMRLRNP